MPTIGRKVRKSLVYCLLSIIISSVILFLLISFRFFTGDFVRRQSEPESLTIHPDSLGLSSEVVRFSSRDGLALEGWLLPASPPGKAVIILSHGGESNRSRMLARAAFLVNGGFDVFAIDLRAHGGSEGNYNSLGMMEALDILGAVDHIQNRGDTRPIILMGLSLGSVSSLNAAAQFPEAAAVIAEGAFITYKDVITRISDLTKNDPKISSLERMRKEIVDWPFVDFVSRLEIWFHSGVFLDPEKTNAIESIRKIPNIPILFLTGENDIVAPASNTEIMLNASKSAQSEMQIINGVGHSVFTESTQEIYEEAVFNFLRTILLNSPISENR